MFFNFKLNFTKVYRKMCVMLAGVMLAAACAAVPANTAYANDLLFASMYERAVDFPQGDLSRLVQVIRRAQNGETVTIGFLGGSITEGRGADSIRECYVSQVCRWWQDAFPDAGLNVINAGIGGTSSYLGVHRVDKELLVYNPDLIFMEFAVNDSFTEFCMGSYENLIRRILTAESNPALVLLFAANEAGDSSQAVEAALGEYYSLPMISYGKAITPEVRSGNFAWFAIAEDIVHPNNTGHSIFAGLIKTFIADVCSRLDTIEINENNLAGYELPEPVTMQTYQNAHIENASTITPVEMTGYGVGNFNRYFSYNWYAAEDNSCLTFEVEACNIGVIYQRTVDGVFGQYDVYIDGEYVRTLDGNFIKYQGTETEAEELYASPDGRKAHHEIRIVKNPQSENIYFILAGLLIS